MIHSLKNRYINLFNLEKGISKNEVQSMEKKLSCFLPDDLKEILAFYDGFFDIAKLSLFSFDTTVEGWNICDQTLYLRHSINLPKEYIVLKEGDEGLIALNCVTKEVVWCGISDVDNLVGGNPLTDNPLIFPTFEAFFEFLLDEEEKMRKEEGSEK